MSRTPDRSTLLDRCPRCRRVDYEPLPELRARCLRCGQVYQRRRALMESESTSPPTQDHVGGHHG